MTAPADPPPAGHAPGGPSTVAPATARRLWTLLEPLHAVVYFAPEARARFDAAGLRGFWMGYFASRAAALGTPGPEVVTAAFYVFHPRAVARALPDAWAMAAPDDVLAARAGLAESVLRPALGDSPGGADSPAPDVAAAAEGAVVAARSAPAAGRVLGAAHAALPVPDDPVLALWWAATALREHRGDGHVAALVSVGIDPCEALVLAAASGAVGPDGAELLRTSRRWNDDEWAAATDRLRARGWLDGRGALTEAGRRARRHVEDATDRSAAAAYAALGEAGAQALAAALEPLTRAVLRRGAIPRFTPIGLDPPG